MGVPPTDARVTLREVTKENLRDILMLRVAPEQDADGELFMRIE